MRCLAVKPQDAMAEIGFDLGVFLGPVGHEFTVEVDVTELFKSDVPKVDQGTAIIPFNERKPSDFKLSKGVQFYRNFDVLINEARCRNYMLEEWDAPIGKRVYHFFKVRCITEYEDIRLGRPQNGAEAWTAPKHMQVRE
jgi:hypothetical protein